MAPKRKTTKDEKAPEKAVGTRTSRKAKPEAKAADAGAATPAASGGAGVVRHSSREQSKEFAVRAARLLQDDKCENVRLLDVTGLSQMCDYIILATGTSDRQMRSCADDLEKLGEEMKFTSFRRSLDERTTWALVDFVHVVAHVFEPNTRAYYDLEMLWGDAPRLDFSRSVEEVATSGRSRGKKASKASEE